MKFITTILLTLFAFEMIAQDTISVQTLTFDDITKRRGEYVFPGADQEFRKILMYYTLKCDPQTTQDGYACGEWDYLTYNFIYEHTGLLDSSLITHPAFYVGTETPASFSYQPNPLFNYYQSYEYFSVIDSIIAEDQIQIGDGVLLSDGPFGMDLQDTRFQYLWTADELTTAGLIGGEIHRIAVETAAGSSAEAEITIRMSHFPVDSLVGLADVEMETVFQQPVTLNPENLQFFDFTAPFLWNGSSSVLIEFIQTGSTGALQVLADTIPSGVAWNANGPDGYIGLDAGQFLKIPVSGEDFGDEITISFWANGNPDALPDNTHLLEAVDATGDRSLNIHFPWGDGRIYWDAGAGTGFDRIDKAASPSLYSGSWNHWTFTKNAVSGIMNIYLNGTLWHTGENKDHAIGELHTFHIGKGAVSNNGYPGFIDEFTVWNTELDAATILEWVNKTPDASHPDFSDLAIYYDFNSTNSVADLSGNDMDALVFGSPSFQSFESESLTKNPVQVNYRPKVIFAGGEYITHIDSMLVVDTVPQQPVSVVSYEVTDQVLQQIVSNWYWPEGCSYWFAPDGTTTDSLCFAAENTLINTEIEYYGSAFEVIDRWEIGRFITPYGINLSLGPDGFTWVYDVTDYAHLLRDTVDLEMGNQQELIDVQFKMITGTPSRDVLKINKVWGDMASHSYASLDNDDALSATDVELLPQTEGLLLKTRLTGHGHNSNTGNYPHCCEWKDNTHYLLVNGNQTESWHIWQTHDCALNPVFPQGGTWPGAREGWCPGDLVKDNDFDLTEFISGNSINLDYDITPVPSNNQGMGGGNYVISMHLFQYGAPFHNNDAEIYEVLNPSKLQYYQRHNPICREPRVVIRNAGSEPLTSATITYGVSGGESLTYNWTGNLGIMETETVSLPVTSTEFWDGDDNHVFEVSIGQPNGASDEYAENDTYKSPFNMPEEYPFDVIVWFKTNNYPNQNSYTIKDINGEIVFEHDDLDAQTIYRDTMDLEPGCYTFEFLDTGNDGLSYWANTAQGSGYLRFKENGGPMIESVEAEFGRSVIRAFSVGDFTSVYDHSPETPVVSVFPNPTKGRLNIEFKEISVSCSIEIFNSLGSKVLSDQRSVAGQRLYSVDISTFTTGIYFVKISSGEFQSTHKVVLE